MATATRPGGLYYVRGVAVDANGEQIKGAPKQAPDTPRENQSSAIPTGNPMEQLAQAITTAIKGKPAKSAKSEEDETDVVDELPTLDEMEDHLAGLDLDAVKALRKKDDRKGAVALYEARIAELEAE